jgi:xanthine dehydrogenase accessory factor
LDIWRELVRLEEESVPAALVTVIRTRGSTPRETGAKMIVYHDGRIAGTVGGSEVEVLVIKDAQEAIAQGRPRRVEYNLNADTKGKSTGMLCGGAMEFFIEPLKQFPRLYIFGGGHVGSALTRLADVVGYPYIVLDSRPEFASRDRFPKAAELFTGPYPELIETVEFLQPAYIVIVTSGHEADYEVLKGALRKPHAYLGLICSRKKKTGLWKKLLEEGVPKEQLDAIHAPIGLDIGAKTPEEIAVAVMAEVISVYYRKKDR